MRHTVESHLGASCRSHLIKVSPLMECAGPRRGAPVSPDRFPVMHILRSFAGWLFLYINLADGSLSGQRAFLSGSHSLRC